MLKRSPFSQLFLIMVAAALAICAISIFSLYRTAIEQHRIRLVQTLQSQARLIESLARPEPANADAGSPGPALLKRVAEAYLEHENFGESGEFVIARRNGSRIEFISNHRHAGADDPASIPLDGDWAQPMRRALSGESGIVNALDYRGTEVLAAYRPIPSLDLGLVAKIDRSEVRRPFLRAALIALITAILVVFAAGRLFFLISRPLQQAMLHQSETFQILAQTAHEGIILADTRGVIQFVNPAAEKLFGYAPRELLDEPLKRLMPPEHSVAHDGYMTRYLQSGMPRIIGTGRQLTAVRKDGSRFPIYLSVGDINTRHGRLFAGVIMDISEQQRLQREVLEIPVSEQRRIGQELHDGLGQQLTGLGMLATSLLNKASKPEYRLAEQLAGGLQQAIAQVRSLSRGLMPVNIDADGFIDSLRDLVESIREHSGLEIVFQPEERIRINDNTSAMHLYRIAQEAINNAMKHARANRVLVAVGRRGHRGFLSIRDDGKGIDPRSEAADGLGLRIMRHRCGLIDAELEIESMPGEGTRITCYFSLDSGQYHI